MELLVKCGTAFVYVMIQRGVCQYFGWQFVAQKNLQDNIMLACAIGLLWHTFSRWF